MATVCCNLTEWDFFYKIGRWQPLRRMRLRRYPLREFCLERVHRHGGERGGARHPTPGRLECLRAGELQSLCEPCYKSAKREIELCGYRRHRALDNLPTDLNHPFNRAR